MSIGGNHLRSMYIKPAFIFSCLVGHLPFVDLRSALKANTASGLHRSDRLGSHSVGERVSCRHAAKLVAG